MKIQYQELKYPDYNNHLFNPKFNKIFEIFENIEAWNCQIKLFIKSLEDYFNPKYEFFKMEYVKKITKYNDDNFTQNETEFMVHLINSFKYLVRLKTDLTFLIENKLFPNLLFDQIDISELNINFNKVNRYLKMRLNALEYLKEQNKYKAYIKYL